MKINLLLFATVLALLMSIAASAQTVNLKMKVPFNFIVNGATLLAGAYSVESMDDQGMVLAIRRQNSSVKNLVISNSCAAAQTPSETKLVFHRYGDRYFLNQIWVEGNNAGHEIPISPRETEVAKDFSMREVVLTVAKR